MNTKQGVLPTGERLQFFSYSKVRSARMCGVRGENKRSKRVLVEERTALEPLWRLLYQLKNGLRVSCQLSVATDRRFPAGIHFRHRKHGRRPLTQND